MFWIAVLILALGLGLTGSGLQGLLLSHVYREAPSSKFEHRVGAILWKIGLPVLGIGLILLVASQV